MIHQMAPWVPQFIQSCKNHTQAFVPFTFATVDTQTMKPKCRTVIFRDFLFHDKRSNVLTFTSDLRGDKVKEIRGNGETTAPFEACFYFPNTWEQYRFSGECFVVSQRDMPAVVQHYASQDAGLIAYPILSPSVCGHIQELLKYDRCSHGEEGDGNGNCAHHDESQDATPEGHETNAHNHGHTHTLGAGGAGGARARPSALDADDDTARVLSRTSTRSSGCTPKRDILSPADYKPPSAHEWQLELQRQWAILSRSTKAQFRKPDPGTPLTSGTSQQLDKIQRGVDGANENAGFDNFGVVCLCVHQVDYLNLKDGRGGERWKYNCHREPGTRLETWVEEEVCP